MMAPTTMPCTSRRCTSRRNAMTGALVTETVFTWPGMGRLFLDSLGYSDYPVVMGLLLFSAILVILGNLIADIVVAIVDPRIRLG